MDRAELMKMSIEEAVNELEWDSIEFLFRPENALELLLRMNEQMVIKQLRKNGMPEPGPIRDELMKALTSQDYYRCLKQEKYKQEKRKSMKFRINMKDPDGVYDSLKDAGYDLDDLPEDVQTLIDKYVEFSEYMNIEFDIKEQTARVVPR